MSPDWPLGPATLAVAALPRSRAFYVDLLGLRVLDESPAHLALGSADGTCLLVLREDPGAAPVPRTGRYGLFHVALLLPTRADLGACLQHLAAHATPIGASDHGVSEALYLRDPDGLGLEIYADRPRDRWHWTQGEVQMTTVPLDGPALAAASTAPWAGMPSGTRVGHVHLQVASLAEAERFYVDTLKLATTLRSYPGARFLARDGYHHHLGLNTWAVGARPAGPGDARLLEWTLRLAPGLTPALHTDPWGTTVRVLAPDES